MNFLYYKNFNDEKTPTTFTPFKRKKETRKKSSHHGTDGKKSSQLNQHKEDRYLASEDKLDQRTKRHVRGQTPPLEPVTVSTLKQDCFMIPIAKMNNFFPDGHPIPSRDTAQLRMLEISEPDIRIAFHMVGPAEPFNHSLSSPLIDIHKYQQECVVKAFKTTVHELKLGTALQGMVLLNLERGGEFGSVEYPFIILWVLDTKRCDAMTTSLRIRQTSLEAMEPELTGYKSQHYFDCFEEVATLAKPPIEKMCRRASTPTTGYIISVFRVFEGDDGDKFERNWLGWTGARALYKSMTPCVGLRRITLHKSNPQKGFLHYVLLCDCTYFLTNLAYAVQAIPRLRMRRCGDNGLYRPICSV